LAGYRSFRTTLITVRVRVASANLRAAVVNGGAWDKPIFNANQVEPQIKQRRMYIRVFTAGQLGSIPVSCQSRNRMARVPIRENNDKNSTSEDKIVDRTVAYPNLIFS